MEEIPLVKKIPLDEVTLGTLQRFRLRLISDSFGDPIWVPVLIAKGIKKGPVVGITALIHGNELNGLRVIQKLFKNIDTKTLSGTIIGFPIVNVSGFLRKTRKFSDGTDLNTKMPGKKGGNRGEVYSYRINERIVEPLDYLIDLHTASFGRINSHYVRAELSHPEVKKLAELQNAQIILHNTGKDGTLRRAAMDKKIVALTVELGDPHRFQKKMIKAALIGIDNIIRHLKMCPGKIKKPAQKPVMCTRSYWIYTEHGGILEVFPSLTDKVKKGEKIAVVRSVFGDILEEYFCPEDGIVIGKSIDPVNQTGSRILHLGVL
jgi:uncharacterized protein